MPPEPLPWDRKDFFREKKYANAYDRVPELLGGSSARWRDPPFHGSRNNDFNRGGFPSDFRRPPGHEYPPARSGERFFQGGGGGFRPSGPARDNRYNRNFRDSRTSINQRDWRGNSYDYNYHHGAPSSGPGRFYEGKDQKSVEAAPARLSRPPMDVANTSNPVHSEEHRDESCDVNKEDTSKEVEKEEPLASDWKPFNWSRPVSLTSKGLVDGGLASSSKGSGESCEVKIDLPLKISTPDESFSGDAVGCLASPTSPEDTSSRKKPRLGWGEGLAKFEKKRVDPDDPQTKGSNAQCTSNSESMHSPAQNSVDKSPRFGGSFELRSPTTPSSAAYMPMFTSRSPTTPALEDKSFMKASEFESDGNKVSLPSISKVQNHFAGVSLNLQDMDNKEFGKLNGLLADLLQKEVFCSLGSGSAKPALNKFLSWKGDISKVLESTESEIDTLENELKSLKPVPGSNNPVSNPSSSFSVQCKEKKSAQLNVQRSQSLPAFSSHKETKTKEDCIDSPGTATSKFTELSSLNKPSSPDQLKSFLESDKYEACSSVHPQDIEGTSGPESETKMEDNSLDNILFANKRTAFEASKLLDKYLPGSDCDIESVETISSTCSPNRLLKEKFLKRKKALAFKERLLSIKYRALQYMWKEELQVLSEKKQRTRSLKRAESSSRSLHASFQKHRSSVRSCPPSPAYNMSLVPRTEVLNFTRKLLSDPQIRCYRNNEMKMPPLILDKQEKMLPGFLSKNGLVQDPYAVEKERALINPWNAEEKEIFLDKYAAFGKDFAKISSFLDHKTTADCIEFYYKNHKADCFKKAKKQQSCAPTTRYLITSEKWKSGKIREMDDERETEAADVLAGICGSLSSEAMSSCITSSADPGDGGTQDCKSWKTSCAEPCAEVDDDNDTCSDESCGYVEPVDWTDEEKSSFVQAFASHGKDFGMISQCVETKTSDQCKVFFSKARKCLGLEEVEMEMQGDEETRQTADDESGKCVQTKTRDECEVFFSNPGDEEMQAADDLDGGSSDVVNENDMNLEAGVDKDFEERSLNQEDEQEEKTPDEVVAEISTRNPQLDLDFAAPGSELKRSASVNDLHHGESSPDSLKLSMQQIERSLLLPTTEASVQPLQVYHLKKCQSSASVQLLGESSSSSSCKDVKLFGQILSKPSTTDKPEHPLSNGSLGLEKTSPPRKYSFWDGNRTQTSTSPSIPDSALILARYPGIFNTEQKLPLLASVASGNTNLGFGSFRLEMNPLSEVPRNGFEAVPGLKQIELNVVDSDSRSVGSFNGLTDPVAALKLHYAKTHRQRGVNPGGDVGR